MAIVDLTFVKDYLGPSVIGDTTDAILNALIIEAEQDYLNIQNKPWDLDDLGDIIYPPGSDCTASRMVGYKLNTKSDDGKVIASESNLSYSVSFGSGNNSTNGGYPKSVTGSIKVWTRGM